MTLRVSTFAPLALAFILAPFALAQKVMPTTAGTGTGTRWSFTMGPMVFQTGAKNGGRIHTLRFDGSDILHMDTGSATSYGSTFWPSPQAVWNWPPPANLDGSGAYAAELRADTVLSMIGLVDNTTKLRFRKEYWADRGDSSYNMRFTMVNTGVARAWSPWQDTRVDTGGIYFFPVGEGAVTGDLAQFVRDSIGMKWYTHGAATTLTGGTTKFYADGSLGWFAHITADRILLLKKFSDSPLSKKAPSPENEIEVYSTNRPLNNSDFVEMEVQGRYDSIVMNDSTSWDMKWYIRKLPDSLTVAAGNPALVAFVNKVLAGNVVRVQGSEPNGLGSRFTYSAGRVIFTAEKSSHISLSLQDTRGRVVQMLHSGQLLKGTHTFRLAPTAKGVHWLVMRDSRDQILSVRKISRL